MAKKPMTKALIVTHFAFSPKYFHLPAIPTRS